MTKSSATIEFEDAKCLLLRGIGMRSTSESLEFALDEIDYWYQLGNLDDDTAYELEKWAMETWPIRWDLPHKHGRSVPQLELELANPRRGNSRNREQASARGEDDGAVEPGRAHAL